MDAFFVVKNKTVARVYFFVERLLRFFCKFKKEFISLKE